MLSRMQVFEWHSGSWKARKKLETANIWDALRHQKANKILSKLVNFFWKDSYLNI